MQNLYITSNNQIIQISLNSWRIFYCFAESSVIRSVAVLNRTAMHQTINQIIVLAGEMDIALESVLGNI